jgi:hypothetical protein
MGDCLFKIGDYVVSAFFRLGKGLNLKKIDVEDFFTVSAILQPKPNDKWRNFVKSSNHADILLEYKNIDFL